MKKILIAEIVVLALLVAVALTIFLTGRREEPGTMQDTQTPGSTSQHTAEQPSTQPSTLPPETQPPTTLPPETQPPTTLPPETQPPADQTFADGLTLECKDYFVYDCASGDMMAISCEADARIYPASITKLFTAYVALQYLEPEAVIQLGDEVDMIQPGSSIAYVRKGHKLTVTQLVKGMLLPSGNDAAYALAAAAAKAESGDASLSAQEAIDRFVELMNDAAAALGMTGTRFCNPDGYHDPDHYTTSADMITIAELSLQNELIRTCTGISSEHVVYVSGEINDWHNSNALVDPESPYYCPDAVGLKTGHTSDAGYCLLSAFEVDGEYMIIGVFGCEGFNDRYADSLALYQAARGIMSE